MRSFTLGPWHQFRITVVKQADGRFQATAYDAGKPGTDGKPTPFVIVIVQDEHDAEATCRQHVTESKAWAQAAKEEAAF